MKYSELISFKPIESTIQLLETADKKVAQDMVQTYVMSDNMAESIKATVIDQLQMEEVVDNKAVMIVGNYGTGKSHLMSVIAAIATDAENLEFAQNKRFAKDMETYAQWFVKKKVPLVITEWVKDKEKPEPLRYLGYIVIGDGERVNLYEVLDACPARERQLKLSLKERFEETIELFYNRDFYLARNSFTEILKECPEDEITRWYLFESDRLLNEGTDDPEFGRIRI